MMLDKKALSTWKRSFDLHVLLIMDQEKVTKSSAISQAYHEGPEGRARRTMPAPKPPSIPPVAEVPVVPLEVKK